MFLHEKYAIFDKEVTDTLAYLDKLDRYGLGESAILSKIVIPILGEYDKTIERVRKSHCNLS